MNPEKMKAAAQKISDSRAVLIKENPFFGHLAMQMKIAGAPCKTACTDGSRLIFDPDFVEKLTEREIQFVVLHEILHCALDHCTRGKGLLADVYNMACDIVVNSLIFQMWKVSVFTVGGEVPAHLTPDGREVRDFNAEEVYEMLVQAGCPGNGNGDSGASAVDRHDLWRGIADPAQTRDIWNNRIHKAAKVCGSQRSLPQIARKLIERAEYKSKVNWRQLLHDFMHFDIYDYTFLPPDRRFSDQDFFLPAYHVCEETGSIPDVWICVDTSASVCDEDLSDLMAEIRDAMRQTGMTGRISFFDVSVTAPEPFSSEEELRERKPVGGGNTSFYAIFRYLKDHIFPDLPRAILIFTDGYAECPPEDAAMGVPVLWLISNGGRTEFPWGTVTEL